MIRITLFTIATLVMLLAIMLLFSVLVPVHAHDGDRAHDAWYGGLHQPKNGVSCCDLQDCKPTDYRITSDGHYEAYIDAQTFGGLYTGWTRVPDDAVIRDKKVLASNPTGRAVTCWVPWGQAPGMSSNADSGTVLCFVPGGGT